jgi:hypothetical protein
MILMMLQRFYTDQWIRRTTVTTNDPSSTRYAYHLHYLRGIVGKKVGVNPIDVKKSNALR